MIPKIIHYCWLSGDPYPDKIQHCINSWKKFLPEYEFMLWDTNKFPLDMHVWVKEAFESKKYAFAADYIRLYAVYSYGGIYLDCDVEVLKPFDDLLSLPYFIGRESFENRVEVAAFGAEKGNLWIKMCLNYYENRHFKKSETLYDTIVMPDVIYNVLSPHYRFNKIDSIEEFVNDEQLFNVFPNNWFCANIHLKPTDELPTYMISSETYCVHHFANSWIKVSWKRKLWLTVLRLYYNLKSKIR